MQEHPFPQRQFLFPLFWLVDRQVALLGSILGTALSALLTDPLVALLMRMEGISNFSSHPGLMTALLPGMVVTALSALFAYLSARGIRRAAPMLLAK